MNAKPSNKALSYTILGCLIVMALGVVVFWNYLMFSKQQQADKDRLPNIRPLDRDLQVTNQFGEKVSFYKLRGKVWVAAFVYTRCRAGCLGVAAHMKKLGESMGASPDFHMVSVTIDGEHDTPEYLGQWTKDNGVGGPNWWFVTGEGNDVRAYMSRYFQLAIDRRKSAEEAKVLGEWEHSFSIALVDRRGMIRGYYNPMDVNFGEAAWIKLREDIARLLKENP